MNFKNIFFSYSRADASDFALKLAIDLQKAGFNVWIDQQDIRAGSEWDLEIGKALETCDCLLFIESEKSVTSSNVLDEVYYAIDQRKMVIPIIYKDSKTPFRINRLQHIDFTNGYDRGLVNLIQELESCTRDGAAQPAVEREIVHPVKPAFKYSRFVWPMALLVIIAAAAIIYRMNGATAPPIAADTTLKKSESIAVQPRTTDTPLVIPKETPAENNVRKPARSTVVQSERPVSKPEEKPADLHETFAGRWSLTGVEPAGRSHQGLLIIEELDEKRVKVVGNFQFYFFETNDTAFFSIFNGYAGCASCVLKKEMPMTDNDVAFGTTTYSILRETQAGVGNAGDTVMTAGRNSSIRAAVTMYLQDKNTVLIKVHKPVPTTIAMGLVVEPFTYTFRFTRRTY